MIERTTGITSTIVHSEIDENKFQLQLQKLIKAMNYWGENIVSKSFRYK